MQTLLLDGAFWDLVLDVNGNIAVAGEPYSQAQDAASGVRTFKKEVYYNTTLGVTYFPDILGKLPPITLLKSQYTTEAKRVPGVTAVQCFFSAISRDRVLSGQVQVTNRAGVTAVATF